MEIRPGGRSRAQQVLGGKQRLEDMLGLWAEGPCFYKVPGHCCFQKLLAYACCQWGGDGVMKQKHIG